MHVSRATTRPCKNHGCAVQELEKVKHQKDRQEGIHPGKEQLKTNPKKQVQDLGTSAVGDHRVDES